MVIVSISRLSVSCIHKKTALNNITHVTLQFIHVNMKMFSLQSRRPADYGLTINVTKRQNIIIWNRIFKSVF